MIVGVAAVIAACIPYGRFFGPHDFDFVVLVGVRAAIALFGMILAVAGWVLHGSGHL